VSGWVALWIAASIALLIFAWMAWQISQTKQELSEAYRTISEMLDHPERAEPIAQKHAAKWGFLTRTSVRR
jgi:predicted negative regulator of RcsB-dependent stress response